jgi:hypothetical protein
MDGQEQWTMLFELTTPFNRIVTNEPVGVTLLGCRRNDNGVEEPYGVLEGLGIIFGLPVVQEYPLQTLEEVLAAASALNGEQDEGFVVVDKDFHRIKVKSPAYVALHHVKDAASPKNFVDVIRRGEASEFLSAFPDLKAEFDRLQKRYELLVWRIKVAWGLSKNIADQKEFAQHVMSTNKNIAPALFTLRSHKAEDARDYLLNARLEKVIEMMEGLDD